MSRGNQDGAVLERSATVAGELAESATVPGAGLSITVNGERVPCRGNGSVLALVAESTGRALGPDGRPSDGRRLGVAVAVNSEVVPRGRWAATLLADGDAVELVTAMQGG